MNDMDGRTHLFEKLRRLRKNEDRESITRQPRSIDLPFDESKESMKMKEGIFDLRIHSHSLLLRSIIFCSTMRCLAEIKGRSPATTTDLALLFELLVLSSGKK
jgi:hypothetical protein